MKKNEIKKACKLIPNFIKLCENELEEDFHEDVKPMTYEEYELVEKLINKLKNLDGYVDTNIFDGKWTSHEEEE